MRLDPLSRASSASVAGSSVVGWITGQRLRVHGIILALCLWSVYGWNVAAPGMLDRNGNLKGAAVDILSANPLGGMCARVCPTEILCEGACVRNHQDAKPVAIGALQRHATDWAMARGEVLFKREAETGRRLNIRCPVATFARTGAKQFQRSVCVPKAGQRGLGQYLAKNPDGYCPDHSCGIPYKAPVLAVGEKA